MNADNEVMTGDRVTYAAYHTESAFRNGTGPPPVREKSAWRVPA